MIIQCEQCQAKFRLDDSKVTEKGVKVRCAKCKHLFTVTRKQPDKDPFDFGSSPEQTPANLQQDETLSATPPQQQIVQEPASEFAFNTDFLEDTAQSTVPLESNPFETTAPAFEAAGNDEFSLSSLEDDKGFDVQQDQAQSTHGEFDFDSLDFGSVGTNADADKTMIAPPASADYGDKTMIQPLVSSAPPVAEAPQELDFSADDIFGTMMQKQTGEPADSNPFDFAANPSADSIDIGGAEAAQAGSSLSPDIRVDSPFSHGEIDFGDELAPPPVSPPNKSELKPSPAMLSVPLAETPERPASDLKKIFSPETIQTEQSDLPPLSIASRRKQSPVFTGLIAVVALLVIGVLGYFGFTTFSEDKAKVSLETGKISVRSVKAVYVKNASAGLLLAISGEAVNEYAKPRAALQVKGMIFDAKGQILVSKSAFGGNLLTDEQLANLPIDRIEVAMANQFGDSLANLEVAPGKAVSFMIVIANLPKEGKDFGVEPLGSTVAAVKQ